MDCALCSHLKENIQWLTGTLSDKVAAIDSLVSAGRLTELGQAMPNGPILAVRYKCNTCGTVWRLTYPDHSLAGGFDRE